MRLRQKDVSSSIELDIEDVAPSDVTNLVESFRARSESISVTYEPGNRCKISAEFGMDLLGAHSFLGQAEQLAEDNSD